MPDEIYMDVYVRFLLNADKESILSSSLRVEMSPEGQKFSFAYQDDDIEIYGENVKA